MPGWTFTMRPVPSNSYDPGYEELRNHQRLLRGLDKVRQFPTYAGPFFPTDMLRGTEVPSLPGHMDVNSGAQYLKLLNLA